MATSLSPLNQLVNNIQGSVNGLVNQILGNPVDSNVPQNPTSKDITNVLSELDASSWSKLSFPYTFSVVAVGDTGTSGADQFTDFSLPLNPQSIRQSEEPAISIRPTQGGTTTTHSGNRYKMLSIKGTTGIAPFRGAGGVTKSDGTAIFQPSDLKYRSGYEVFIRLRNWFRAYYEFKKTNGQEAAGIRLCFKNYKDGEFLIVELEKFEMERQAGKAFLYDYELEFKVLAHLQTSLAAELTSNTTAFENALNDALAVVNQARGTFLATQQILRQVEATYESVIVEPLRKVSLALKAALGVPSVAADMGNKAITNTVSVAASFAILSYVANQQDAGQNTGTVDPQLASAKLPKDLQAAAQTQGAQAVLNLNQALMVIDPAVFPQATRNQLAQDQQDAANLPRSFYTNLLNDLERVRENAEDFFNLGDPQYDAIFGRTATLTASPTKVITSDELDVLKAFNDAATGISLLLSTQELFKSSYDQRIADINARFNGNLDLTAQPAVRQMKYDGGMTLERLAQKELGDSTRWGEIAEVNNLKPPYITENRSDTTQNVLRPGDVVLIPTGVKNGFSQVPAVADIKTTVGLTALEKSLGTDLKLTPEFDLSISNAGDLEVISGTGNMGQAVVLKLSYEKGEVMRYPQMGASILPGTKFPAIQTIKDGVVNTLLQDSRVESIEQLQLRQDNGALFLEFTLWIKNIDIPVPISIKV